MMESAGILSSVWFVLIGILFAGYTILDGFDLGIGVLFPVLAKSDEDRAVLIRAIGPFWDGNEVWLLTAGGALFAAFPHVYATVFSGFYLALMLVLFALIFRAVSLEFRSHDLRRKAFWEWAFIGGSFIPALFFGVALGNIIRGIPLDREMNFAGNFFNLLNPFSLAAGVLGLTAILMQGAVYAVLKTSGDLRSRARFASRILARVFLSVLAVATVLAQLFVSRSSGNIIPWGILAVAVGCIFFLMRALSQEKDGRAFFFSSAALAGLWGIVGAVLYPNIVPALNDPGLSLNVFNASSSPLTLKVMLIIAVLGMPPVIGYTIYLYRVFRGRVKEENGAGYGLSSPSSEENISDSDQGQN